MKKLLLLLSLATLILTSCRIDPDTDIRILQLRRFDTRGTTMSRSKVDVTVEIYSSARQTFTISDAEFIINSAGKELFTVRLEDKVTIRKQGTSDIKIPLDIRYDMAGAMMALTQEWNALAQDNLRVNGYIKIRKFLVAKTIPIENVSFHDFAEITGLRQLLTR